MRNSASKWVVVTLLITIVVMNSQFVAAYSPPPIPTPKRTNLSKPLLIDTHLEPQKLGPDSTGQLYVKVRNIGKTGEMSVVTTTGTHVFIRPSSKTMALQENESTIFNFTVITTTSRATADDLIIYVNVMGETEDADSTTVHLQPLQTPYEPSVPHQSNNTPSPVQNKTPWFIAAIIIFSLFIAIYLKNK